VLDVGRTSEQLDGNAAGPSSAPGDAADYVAESPSGATLRPTPSDDGHLIELDEQGFYSIRRAGGPSGSAKPIAVNVDVAESNLAKLDPQELVAAVAPKTAGGQPGSLGAPPTAEEQERRQTLWWYLLVGALMLLGAETILSNRLSRAAR
jgi:hypothetical protein